MTKELIKMAKEIKLKDEAWKEERRRLEFQRKFEAEENKRRIEELLEEQKIIAEKARKEQEKLNAQLGAKLEAKLQKLGEKTLEGAEEKIREADAVIQAREKLEKGDQEEPRRLSTMIKQDSRTAMTIRMSRKHGIIGIIFLLLLLVLLGLTAHYAVIFFGKSDTGKERTINKCLFILGGCICHTSVTLIAQVLVQCWFQVVVYVISTCNVKIVQ